jgi:predicted metal-dependent peptidase
MEDSAQEKLRISFMRIMNCRAIKLFGALIYKFQTRIVDDPKLTAFVYFNGKTPNIVFGKQLVERHNIKQVTFIMLHEMLHFINNHHKRGMKYDRVVANMAADHVINEILLKDLGQVNMETTDKHGNVSTHRTKDMISEVAEACSDPKPFTVEELLGKENNTFEGVYEWLMKNKVQYVQITQECSSCGGSGKGSGQNKGEEDKDEQKEGEGDCPDCNGSGENQGNNDGKTKYKVKIKGQEDQEFTPDIDSNPDDPEKAEEASGEKSDELKENLRAIINANKDSELTRGMEGGNLLQYIKELVKIEIPWNELLEIAIKSHTIPSIEERSWKNPMKRMRVHGITIPGEGTDVTASTMVVIIDTSGSVGDDDLAKFLSICTDSLIHFDRLVVIQHDSAITKTTIVDKENMEFGLDDVAHFAGRGGTSHTEVFVRLEEMWQEDDEVGLVVMLTDFYSDVEENWRSGKFNWVEDYPVKVCLNHSQVNMVHADIDEHPIVIKEVE